MSYFIGQSGYYEGQNKGGDLEVPVRPSNYYEWIGGEWALDIERSKGDRITALQVAYESDLEKLNKGWLAALISDGEGEVDRQATLLAQMQILAEQLDADILTIIME